MKYFKIILSVLIAQLLGITDISAQVKIEKRYLLQGGKGAETTMTLIGDITDTVPINYYLSYNVCVSENVWMIHCVPWTDFEVILPYDAKVLFKTFKGNVIELKAFTKENGTRRFDCKLNKKVYQKYISGVHCELSGNQLEVLLHEGIKKIRIETTFPKGYIEREYNDLQLTQSLNYARNLLIDELKSIDIHNDF